MKEEDFIRKKCGSKDPFRVPEGYFEHFTADLMGKLPEKENRRTASRLFRLTRVAEYAAAAVVCGLIFTGAWHFAHHARQEEASVCHTATGSPHEEGTDIEDYLDYAMISNQEIAQYLTEAY